MTQENHNSIGNALALRKARDIRHLNAINDEDLQSSIAFFQHAINRKFNRD